MSGPDPYVAPEADPYVAPVREPALVRHLRLVCDRYAVSVDASGWTEGRGARVLVVDGEHGDWTPSRPPPLWWRFHHAYTALLACMAGANAQFALDHAGAFPVWGVLAVVGGLGCSLSVLWRLTVGRGVPPAG